MAVVLLIVGALLTVAGSALFDWRAAIVVAGLLCLAAGVDLARIPRSGP